MALLINNQVTASLLTLGECMEALEFVLKEKGKGEATDRNKANIHIPTEDSKLWYRYCSMEGGSRGLKAVAIRIKSDMVSWPEVKGYLREQKYTSLPGLYGGLVLLFSAVNGELLAIFNDGLLQHARVAGTYGLGVRYTARSDARVLGIIGSGAMARLNAEAFCLVRPITKIKVFSLHVEHRERFVEEMSEQLKVEVVPVDSPEQAARGADILAGMTDSMEPVIYPGLLEDGMCLCTVTNAEMSPLAYQRVDRMVLARTSISDHYFTTPEDQRPLHLGGSNRKFMEWESAIPADRVHELSDVMLGCAPGRENDREIVFFQSEGMGTQFVAVALKVYEKAREKGLGEELPNKWFLQDVRT